MTSTQRRIALASITLCILVVVVAATMGVFSAPPELLQAPFDGEAAGESQQQWADYLGVEPSLKNTIGMEFRLVPPGEFKMGSMMEIDFGSGPQHDVRITQPFWLGVYEVTQAEWAEVTGKNPSWFVFLGGRQRRCCRIEYDQVSRGIGQLV